MMHKTYHQTRLTGDTVARLAAAQGVIVLSAVLGGGSFVACLLNSAIHVHVGIQVTLHGEGLCVPVRIPRWQKL